MRKTRHIRHTPAARSSPSVYSIDPEPVFEDLVEDLRTTNDDFVELTRFRGRVLV